MGVLPRVKNAQSCGPRVKNDYGCVTKGKECPVLWSHAVPESWVLARALDMLLWTGLWLPITASCTAAAEASSQQEALLAMAGRDKGGSKLAYAHFAPQLPALF